MRRSAHAITHLIPEVRLLPGQRFALFKNTPGVFIRAAGRFPLLAVFPAPRGLSFAVSIYSDLSLFAFMKGASGAFFYGIKR